MPEKELVGPEEEKLNKENFKTRSNSLILDDNTHIVDAGMCEYLVRIQRDNKGYQK